jgi:hypothetical protein
MPKQKGGYPFTDGWFEMPFWILLISGIITVIVLASLGIFNPKPQGAQEHPSNNHHHKNPNYHNAAYSSHLLEATSPSKTPALPASISEHYGSFN